MLVAHLPLNVRSFHQVGLGFEEACFNKREKRERGSQRAPKSSEPIGIASNRFLGLILDGFMLQTVPQLSLSSEIDYFRSESAYFSRKSRIRAGVPADSSGAKGYAPAEKLYRA